MSSLAICLPARRRSAQRAILVCSRSLRAADLLSFSPDDGDQLFVIIAYNDSRAVVSLYRTSRSAEVASNAEWLVSLRRDSVRTTHQDVSTCMNRCGTVLSVACLPSPDESVSLSFEKNWKVLHGTVLLRGRIWPVVGSFEQGDLHSIQFWQSPARIRTRKHTNIRLRIILIL